MDEIGKDAPFKTAVKECAALIRSGAEGIASAIADLFDVNYAQLEVAG